MPEFPAFVKALLDPQTYPERPQKIDLVQTQMSFLFIGDEYVYKVKKPVNLGYLDYSTLEMRRALCLKEVELNRRLCPDTYLGVVAICSCDGQFKFDEQGQIIEYAVKMRKLPLDRMMDALLPSDAVTPAMVSALAKKLADFHAEAATGAEINRFGDLEMIKFNTAENFSQTDKYVGRTATRAKYDRIKAYTEDFIARNEKLFQQRVTNARIRDCHGDLHAAHICFQDGICVYDCIEFNDRFRYADVASEIAFLAMDIDHYGKAELSRDFVHAYLRAGGDRQIEELLKFYKCYRAYIRGKVEGFKLDDPYISPEEKARTVERARNYFDLSLAYTRQKPLLLITAGLMGTGKSTLADVLAKRLGVAVISSDVIRKKLASVPVKEAHHDSYDSGLYAPEFTQKTYDHMLARGRSLLADGIPVLLDASFSRKADRRRAKDLAELAGADYYFLECVAGEPVIKQRLESRVKKGSISDGRWEIFAEQKSRFEAIDESPQHHIVVDMSGDTQQAAELVLGKVI